MLTNTVQVIKLQTCNLGCRNHCAVGRIHQDQVRGLLKNSMPMFCVSRHTIKPGTPELGMTEHGTPAERRNTAGTTEHHRNTEQRNAEHQWNSRNTTEYRNNGTPQKLEPKDKHGIFIIFNFHSNAKLSERWTGKRILIKSFGRRKLYGNEDTPPFLTFFSTVALLPSRCSWKDSWK